MSFIISDWLTNQHCIVLSVANILELSILQLTLLTILHQHLGYRSNSKNYAIYEPQCLKFYYLFLLER